MIVLRIIGTVLWFAIPAGMLTFAVHDLGVRDAPTYDIEGTVVAHRQVYHPAESDSPAWTTYFITVRSAGEPDWEFGDPQQALDTEPGTPVVVQVSKVTDWALFVRKGGTVVDLRTALGTDVWLLVLGGLGALIALARESLLEDRHVAGFVLGALAAGGGVYLGLQLGS
ncbi:hypothetical protein Amsp01_065480 [Amycolatopsis sp. NBRC 101858]|uniref:hypothetical protein n=1 Tax=Amycolatopsis sp. NBRC 101858 TaxID=3032200 RepID=UPI0024A05458|nr:hypothetical protein [Amycolatopsis sp. NBRC 101858]GLY40525.1 hypothetical protein Amsp01_065480 [Amycolatopsis sp. NBRC 101858]